MKQDYLIEENLPPRLPIRFSSKIYNQIDNIYTYNQNNVNALLDWLDYIDGLKSYISHRKIAWDYANRYIRFPNGAVHLIELGYDVTYIIKTNKATNKNYIYVFKIDLKTEEYGLNIPPSLTEDKNVIRLTESMLKSMIAESLMNILNEYHEYKPVSRNKEITLNNGVKVKSIVTLSDGAGVYEIWEDDGCYVCCDMNYYRNNDDYQPMYIFPELLKALKKLPNLPLQ